MKKIPIVLLLGISMLVYGSQIVYTTPNGNKYHSTKNCRTLKRSKIINEININSSGNRKFCKICY